MKLSASNIAWPGNDVHSFLDCCAENGCQGVELPINKIWKNDQIKKARVKLKNNTRGFLPCYNCDVKGDVMGKRNFDAWGNILC